MECVVVCAQRVWILSKVIPLFLGRFRIAIPVHVCDYLPLSHIPLYTPPHVSANPISLTCFICLGLGNAFVKTSAVCSGSRQLSTSMIFCSFKS